MNSVKLQDKTYRSIFLTLTVNFQNENLRIPFTTASKRVRFLAINPTKEVKATLENCETARENLKTTHRRGTVHCGHGLEEYC